MSALTDIHPSSSSYIAYTQKGSHGSGKDWPPTTTFIDSSMDAERSLDDTISERRGPRSSARGRGQARGRGGSYQSNGPYNRPPPRDSNNTWSHDMYPSSRPHEGSAARRGQVPLGSETKLEIDNLHYEVSKEDLVNIFTRVGTLVGSPDIIFDRSGRSTGKAFVTYETNKQAKDAINTFDGNTAKGQALQIKFAYSQPPPRLSEGATSLLGRLEGGSRLQRDSQEQRFASGPHRSRDGPFRGGPPHRDSPQGYGSRNDRGFGGKHRDDIHRGTRQSSGNHRDNRDSRGSRPAKKAPMTAEDLDKQLDGYHKKPEASTGAGPATAPLTDGDVEMS